MDDFPAAPPGLSEWREPITLPPLPSPDIPERRPRWGLHLTLFGATFATAVMAGSWFWEGTLDPNGSWAENLAASRLAQGIPYAVLLLAILLAHELGHYVACRRYGVPATLPFFIPGIPMLVGTFGAVIRIKGRIPSRKALFDIAAAGPIAGFVVAVPVMVVGVLRAIEIPPDPAARGSLGPPLLSTILEHLFHGSADIRVNGIYGAAWVGMLVTSMNLFPVGQLDGGHAVFALSPRAHRIVSWCTIAAVGALVASQTVLLASVSSYTLWLVILLVLRGRHPRLGDEQAPLDRGRVALAVLLALIFVLTFIPVPISLD